jgi:hypothetical protein
VGSTPILSSLVADIAKWLALLDILSPGCAGRLALKIE